MTVDVVATLPDNTSTTTDATHVEPASFSTTESVFDAYALNSLSQQQPPLWTGPTSDGSNPKSHGAALSGHHLSHRPSRHIVQLGSLGNHISKLVSKQLSKTHTGTRKASVDPLDTQGLGTVAATAQFTLACTCAALKWHTHLPYILGHTVIGAGVLSLPFCMHALGWIPGLLTIGACASKAIQFHTTQPQKQLRLHVSCALQIKCWWKAARSVSLPTVQLCTPYLAGEQRLAS